MCDEFERALREVLAADDRYHRDAYLFLFQALERTLSRLDERRHVTGGELLDGIREYAVVMYGPTSRLVFEHWGIRSTLDFGHIVFNLVRAGLLARTENDSLDDFREAFDFKKVFEDEYAWTTERES